NYISLIIERGEKIAFVGRIGASKNSFIQTLCRIDKLVDDHSIIDDFDIIFVVLDDVQRHISIVPQDPALFTSTIRSNLDHFGLYSDVKIWNVLEQVCHYLMRFFVIN
ncbi:unnamed protein product, partial [Rotaria sordida]